MSAKRFEPGQNTRPFIKGSLLYLLPLPLLFAAIGDLNNGDLSALIGSAGGFVLAITSAYLLRKGIAIENEAKLRKIVRRSSTVPYKMLAAGVLGVATSLAAFLAADHGIISSVLFGATATLGSWLYYGFDPSRSNPDMPAIGVTAEEVIEMLDEAEGKIRAIDAARSQIRNLEFKDRLRRITKEVRVILDIIENDPKDLRRARKFLKVYLEGAMRVTQGYAETHRNQESPALEDNFRRVLGTIETTVTEQQQKLLANDISDLDVQIEVLQMQLEKEGVV